MIRSITGAIRKQQRSHKEILFQIYMQRAVIFTKYILHIPKTDSAAFGGVLSFETKLIHIF